MQVTQGALILTGGGSSAGTFDLAAGTNLQPTGNYSLLAGATSIGAGEVKVAGIGSDILTVAGAASVANLRLEASGWLSANAPVTVGNLTQTGFGSLFGPADVTVNGALAWNGGTMFGPGKTILNGTGTISNPITGQFPTLDGRTVDNAGTISVTTGTSTPFRFNGNAVWNNLAGAVLQVGVITRVGTSPNAVILNAGTIRKTGAAITSSIGVPLLNTGRVEVLGGDLTTTPNSRSSGVVDIAATGRWVLGNSGNHFPRRRRDDHRRRA